MEDLLGMLLHMVFYSTKKTFLVTMMSEPLYPFQFVRRANLCVFRNFTLLSRLLIAQSSLLCSTMKVLFSILIASTFPSLLAFETLHDFTKYLKLFV